MPALGDIDYLAHLRADSARFVDVLAGADPTLPVPSCPGWTIDDLMWHLGEVQLFWGTIVEQRLSDPDTAEAAKPTRPDTHDGLVEFFRTSSALLVGALEATPPETEIWTWVRSDQSAGFVRRRQAHEALIHRLDAELATGQVTDLDPALATDGVAEVFDWMFTAAPRWADSATNGPIGRVATTDTGVDWLVQVGSWSGTSPRTGTSYTDEGSLTVVGSGEATFTVSGTAQDLDAWLWNRPPRGDIALDGDYEPFAAVIAEGVQ